MTTTTAKVRASRRILFPLLAGALLFAGGCDRGPELETRTFDLQYLHGEDARFIVQPYVYEDRPGAPGRMSTFDGGITVREVPENLDRIARVLEERDRPRPGVNLHFQLIEADGPGEPDARIEEVERVLRELFRFEGYRLLAETQLGSMEGGTGLQEFQTPDGASNQLHVQVHRIRGTPERGSVELEVRLFGDATGMMESGMTIPAGQTVVMGSSQPDAARGAVILTVRPELVTP